LGDESKPAELKMTMEDVIILEQGQEQTQKFSKALSTQYAGDILQLLREAGPLPLNDIRKKLGLSMNAAKHHIKNLMDADILEISNTRYSVKGRKVKMFAMKNQIIIIAPAMTEKKQILSSILKYGSFLCVYILVAVAFLAFVPLTALTGAIPLSGSLQPGVPVNGAAVLPEFLQACIAGLILAAFVTMLILVCYQMIVYWKQHGSSSTI
jgi:DNA-binding transcriptional ArsR family regulator